MNSGHFNEIMPTIYSRFMEKEAREWRQIYKVCLACWEHSKWSKLDKEGLFANAQALTLLEFLVKNGSERVVDDARAHISTIKMLRSFHYIDEKGKDQGINGKSNEPFPPCTITNISPKPIFRDCAASERC